MKAQTGSAFPQRRRFRRKQALQMPLPSTIPPVKTRLERPAGRWGDPEDMVGPCVFLASHASDFVNGQILYADGGILAYIGRQPK